MPWLDSVEDSILSVFEMLAPMEAAFEKIGRQPGLRDPTSTTIQTNLAMLLSTIMWGSGSGHLSALVMRVEKAMFKRI